MVGPVSVHDVADDLVAPAVHEVHVDVRHRHALGVEEALERQPVGDGIDVRHVQGVQDEAARGRAPHRGEDAAALGEVHEVLDDKKVRREAHPLDDAELVVESLARLRRGRRVFLAQAGLAEIAQVGFWGLARGDGKVRELDAAELEVEPGPLRDLEGGGQGLRQLSEHARHLLARLEVELGRAAHPRLVRGVQVDVHLDAHQRILGVGLGAFDVVHVVRRDERQLKRAGQLAHPGDILRLLGHPVRLDLEVEVAGPEDLTVATREIAGR